MNVSIPLVVVLGAVVLFAGACLLIRPVVLDLLALRTARTNAAPVPMRWEDALFRALPRSRD